MGRSRTKALELQGFVCTPVRSFLSCRKMHNKPTVPPAAIFSWRMSPSSDTKPNLICPEAFLGATSVFNDLADVLNLNFLATLSLFNIYLYNL